MSCALFFMLWQFAYVYVYVPILPLSWSLSPFIPFNNFPLSWVFVVKWNKLFAKKKNLWQKRWSINMLRNTHKAYTNRCLWTLAQLLYAYESIQHRANHDDDNGNSQLCVSVWFRWQMARIRFGVILNTVRLYDNAHYYLRHRMIFNAQKLWCAPFCRLPRSFFAPSVPELKMWTVEPTAGHCGCNWRKLNTFSCYWVTSHLQNTWRTIWAGT